MFKLLRIGLALLSAILCWEILITFLSERITGFDIDTRLGVVARPGISVQALEGFSIERINSRYTRGAKFDINDASKRRVTVLGDSYAEATQVDEASSFEEAAQQKFRENGRSDIQILNAGHSGKSPPYYIATGKAWMDFLHSDFVVVQLNEGDFASDFYNPSEDAYMKRDGEDLTLIRKPLEQNNLAGLASRSGIITRIKRIMAERKGGKTKKSPETPADPSFAQETLWFMREAKKTFPHVAVVYVPTMDYYQPETLSQLPPLEVSLEKAAKEEGVPYVNVRPQFAQYFLETNQPCHGFNNTKPGIGHPNGYGHRLMGEALYQLISPLVAK